MLELDDMPCCPTMFWVYQAICLTLLIVAGITSGLALGLLSFSQVELEVLIKAGQPQEKKNAARIMPFVRNGHLLLCTLLTCKSLALAALPIFMSANLPEWAAITLTMALELAFVEIIPQAGFARYGLSVGAKLANFVTLLLLVFFPISYPISKLLDWVFGKELHSLFGRAELKTLVDLHANEAGRGGDLSHHETSIITGALDLTEKTAKDVMTPLSETFCLDINSKLDMHTMGLIMSKGHSRIPIYSGHRKNIVGLILVKELIFCHTEEEIPIKYTPIRRIPRVYDDWPLYDVLQLFEKGHCKMAVVIKRKEAAHNIANNAIRNTSMITIYASSSSQPAELRALSTIGEKEYLSTSTDASSTCSTDTDYHSARMTHFIELGEYLYPLHKQRERGDRQNLQEYQESYRKFLDEEVIGIITIQDVMEELLQADILDEDDHYVDVHNRIRINPFSSIRPPLRSPRRSSASDVQWRTPEPSPPNQLEEVNPVGDRKETA